jgi:hypothetical protein
MHHAMNTRVVRVLEGQGNVTTVGLPDGLTVEEAVVRYRRSGLVQFAEPDYRVSAATTLPSDPWFQNGTLWGLNNYGQSGGVSDADNDAPEGWDEVRSGTNVIVAIIDSGIRATHLDLHRVCERTRRPGDQSELGRLRAVRNPVECHGGKTWKALKWSAQSDNARN